MVKIFLSFNADNLQDRACAFRTMTLLSFYGIEVFLPKESEAFDSDSIKRNIDAADYFATIAHTKVSEAQIEQSCYALKQGKDRFFVYLEGTQSAKRVKRLRQLNESIVIKSGLFKDSGIDRKLALLPDKPDKTKGKEAFRGFLYLLCGLMRIAQATDPSLNHIERKNSKKI